MFAPVAARSAGHAHDLRFRGCEFRGDVTTIGASDYDLRDVGFSDCAFSTEQSIAWHAARLWFRGCTWAAGTSVATDAENLLFDGNVWPAALTDAGASTLTGTNFVV